MVPQTLRIVVIDPDQKLHQTYESYFNSVPDYELIGIYDSIRVVVSDYDSLLPDIIISEVTLNGLNGIDGITQLRNKDQAVKIIMMSLQNQFETIKKAFRKGANGYLTKPVTKTRFLNALNSVELHGMVMGHDVAKKIISSFQRKTLASFSPRENQIIEHLTQGATYKMIARRLFVTPSTVSFHIQNIYLKLNVNSKSEALEKLREMEFRQFDRAS